MYANLAMVSGRLAVPPDVEWLPDGSQRARLLVFVRSRSRFDVLPILVPPEVNSDALAVAPAGARVFVAGPLTRRCSPFLGESPGRLEVVAASVGFPEFDDEEAPGRRVSRGSGEKQTRGATWFDLTPASPALDVEEACRHL